MVGTSHSDGDGQAIAPAAMAEARVGMGRWRRAWHRGLTLASVLLMLIGLAGCGGVPAAIDVRKPAPSAATPAPDFALPRLDGHGVLTLADLRGRVVVLNVWASWCPPCRAEAPTLSAVARTFVDRGVTVLGVNIQDDPQAAQRFIVDYELTYPNVRDEDGRVALAYGAFGLPTTLFIDRQGQIARRWVGPLSERQLVAFIEEIV